MKQTCDICGKKYKLIEKRIGADTDFWAWYGDRIRIERVGYEAMHYYSFNVCPNCSVEILNYVRSKQHTDDCELQIEWFERGGMSDEKIVRNDA